MELGFNNFNEPQLNSETKFESVPVNHHPLFSPYHRSLRIDLINYICLLDHIRNSFNSNETVL